MLNFDYKRSVHHQTSVGDGGTTTVRETRGWLAEAGNCTRQKRMGGGGTTTDGMGVGGWGQCRGCSDEYSDADSAVAAVV